LLMVKNRPGMTGRLRKKSLEKLNISIKNNHYFS
jgi:hypothetical protein